MAAERRLADCRGEVQTSDDEEAVIVQGSSAETGEVAASGVQDDGQPYRRVVLKLSGEVFGGGKLGVYQPRHQRPLSRS